MSACPPKKHVFEPLYKRMFKVNKNKHKDRFPTEFRI